MTKNEKKPPNITVINSSGEKIGFTYEKRAIGLVKKVGQFIYPTKTRVRLSDLMTVRRVKTWRILLWII